MASLFNKKPTATRTRAPKVVIDPALRVAVTAAQCAACGRRDQRISVRRPGWFWCAWCGAIWNPHP